MIKGFEDMTEPLNDEESAVVEDVARALYESQLFIRNDELCRLVGWPGGNKRSGGRMRKVINAVRRSGKVPCVIATSAGYKMASSRAEATDYIASLSHRINAQKAVLDAFVEQFAQTFGQMELFE